MNYHPWCTRCLTPFVFEPHEPFAYCYCGTSEWGDPRPKRVVIGRVAFYFLWPLVRIGFIAPDQEGRLRWPFRADWRGMTLRHRIAWYGWKPYRFRNLPHVRKRIEGRLLPRRWGGGWLGFEFGDRGLL